jgi:hypothetical protein
LQPFSFFSQEEIYIEMFECLERNESLVELSLANTGMTDTAAAVLARALGRMQLLLLFLKIFFRDRCNWCIGSQTTRLDLIRTRLDLIRTRLNLIRNYYYAEVIS